MAVLWIVHREHSARAALARLAAAPDDCVLGSPTDPVFDSAATPDAVILGLSSDLEAELEFAHRTQPRVGERAWLLVAERRRLEAARALFDTLPATWLVWPPERETLRAAISSAAANLPNPLPLGRRRLRDALSQRFARCFSDLELPELLRALDPRLADVPVTLLGEPGSGRGTLARYLHHFGGSAGGSLLCVVCAPETTSAELLDALAAGAPHWRPGQLASICLEEAGDLSPAVQRQIAGWIQGGVPAALPTDALRWLATAREHDLDLRLRRAMSGLCLRVPPLRERPGLVPSFADATARAWCSARGLRPRRFGEHALEVLEEYPWPGNLRELEALVEQSLAASAADPLGPEDLMLDGSAFAPFDAGAAAEPRPVTRSEVGPSEVTPREVEPPEVAAPEVAAPEVAARQVAARQVETAEAAPAEAETHEGPSPEEVLATLQQAPAPAGPPDPPTSGPQRGGLRRLAAALSHEVRNPLTAVRTFTELLPERFGDAEFREEFGRLALENLARVEGVLERLDRAASFGPPEQLPVDVGGLVEEVLDRRRKRIHDRRLLVLEELDRSHPRALCDPAQLRFAFEAIVDRALELVPERGDLYLASKRNDAGPEGAASVRVLLRWRGPDSGTERGGLGDLAPAANALDFAVAEMVIRSQGGSVALDTSERSETVLVIDLPA